MEKLEQVILVDKNDVEIGVMEKMEAHRKPNLHRAFSIFIFKENGEMLLQQRAENKYHSGGLWSNACCSHPMPGEDILTAANRRLMEEMGFTTDLHKAFNFTYKTHFKNGLVEYEFDHVLIGKYSDTIFPNKNEVQNFCYKSIFEIKSDLISSPEKYTAWFKIVLPKLEENLQKNTLHSFKILNSF